MMAISQPLLSDQFGGRIRGEVTKAVHFPNHKKDR